VTGGRAVRAVTIVVAVCGSLIGCSSGTDGAGTTTTVVARGSGPVTYVALGSTDTNGGRDGQPLVETWPHLLYRTHLPARAVFVNQARDRSTVADALREQVDEAVELNPTVATVWFGTSDAFAGTDPEQFGDDLTTLVDRIVGTGAQVVLILGPPPPDGEVDTVPYTDQAEAVAAAAGVEVVDLRDATTAPDDQADIADAVSAALGPIE